MKKLFFQNKQLLYYCIIGGSGAALDFCSYSLLIKAGIFDYQAANVVGYASGTLLSFIFNARYNFRVTDKIGVRLSIFFGVAFLGWVISAGLIAQLIACYGFGKYISKLVTLVAVVVLQYNLNRLLTFR